MSWCKIIGWQFTPGHLVPALHTVSVSEVLLSLGSINGRVLPPMFLHYFRGLKLLYRNPEVINCFDIYEVPCCPRVDKCWEGKEGHMTRSQAKNHENLEWQCIYIIILEIREDLNRPLIAIQLGSTVIKLKVALQSCKLWLQLMILHFSLFCSSKSHQILNACLPRKNVLSGNNSLKDRVHKATWHLESSDIQFYWHMVVLYTWRSLSYSVSFQDILIKLSTPC